LKLPRAKTTVVFKSLSDGALLFSTEDETYLGLNEVGSRVWQLLPPACQTLQEMVQQLAQTYPEVDTDVIRTDVLELLDDLRKHGLLLADQEAAEPLN
jgi:hypothetical protein